MSMLFLGGSFVFGFEVLLFEITLFIIAIGASPPVP